MMPDTGREGGPLPPDLLALLHSPLHGAGSGRVRYGAAMALWRAGQMSEAQLEVYREAAADDGRDPAAMLRDRNLPPVRPPRRDAGHALDTLVRAIEDYLLGLSHPGAAEVRAGLARRPLQPIDLRPHPNPVVARWLDTALAAIEAPHHALARAIADASAHLEWMTYDAYPRDLAGEAFAEGHAFAPLIGETAPYRAAEFELGLFLIAPHVTYRDHWHPATELYAPLTGPHGWRFGVDAPRQIKSAHEPVWNPPNHPHLTRTGSAPFLAVFVWTSDVTAIAHILPAQDWPALEEWRI